MKTKPPKDKPLSKTKRRDILRRVASHISRWPHLYEFMESRIPGKKCKGCLLGRAGVLLGLGPEYTDPHDEGGRSGQHLDDVARALGYDRQGTFYDAVGRAAGGDDYPGPDLWVDIPAVAAALRKLADNP